MTYEPKNSNYRPPQQQPGAYGQHQPGPYAQQPNPYAQQPNVYAAPPGYSPAYGYPPGYPYAAAAPTQSGMGIASFILGLISAVAMAVMMVMAVGIAAKAPGGEINENSPEAMALGCSLLIGGGLAVLGLILGIVAALQQGKKKVFSILGIVFNGGLLLRVGGLMVLGAAVG